MPPAARKVLALLALAAAARAAAEGTVLRYGQAPSAHRSVYSLPLAVAEREGFFSREKLEVRVIVPMDGGADRLVAGLFDGTFDLVHVATPFLVRAALAGADAVAVATEFNDPIYSLVAQPRFGRLEELKGETVGLADPGGSITYSALKLLARHGIAAGDFTTRTVEGTPARLGCLRRGECAAVPLGQPQDFVALAEGYKLLGRSTDAVPPYLYTVTAARRSWAAANEDTVVRYVKALGGALRLIADPQARGRVAAVLADITDVSPAIAEQVLALYAEPGRRALPREGEIDLQGIRQVLAFMAEQGQLKGPLPLAERFVDDRYLRRAGIR